MTETGNDGIEPGRTEITEGKGLLPFLILFQFC